jgi:hypothetical protein
VKEEAPEVRDLRAILRTMVVVAAAAQLLPFWPSPCRSDRTTPSKLTSAEVVRQRLVEVQWALRGQKAKMEATLLCAELAEPIY